VAQRILPHIIKVSRIGNGKREYHGHTNQFESEVFWLRRADYMGLENGSEKTFE